MERIRELAQHYPDDQIAACLNQDNIRTATGGSWNRRRVENVRKQHRIPTACPYFRREEGPRGDGLIAAPEAAQRLGLSSSMVSYWFRQGVLVGHQREPQTPVWVRLMEEDIRRLDGSTLPRPELVPIDEAARRLALTVAQVWEQIRAGRLVPYRLRVKNRWLWHIEVIPTQQDLATDP